MWCTLTDYTYGELKLEKYSALATLVIKCSLFFLIHHIAIKQSRKLENATIDILFCLFCLFSFQSRYCIRMESSRKVCPNFPCIACLFKMRDRILTKSLQHSMHLLCLKREEFKNLVIIICSSFLFFDNFVKRKAENLCLIHGHF